MQTLMAETSADTIWQAIRNTIAILGPLAKQQNIVAWLSNGNPPYMPRYIASCLLVLEAEHGITRTATGAYVLGNHKPLDAQELELTSPDPIFGQPSLF